MARAGRFVDEGLTLDTPARALHFELLPADYRAMVRHLFARASGYRWSFRIFIFASVFVAFLGAALLGRNGRAFIAGVLLGFLLIVARWLLSLRQLQPRPGGAWLCPYDVQLSDGGMRVQTPNWTCDVPWHGVVAVEETGTHCFLRIDNWSVYTIPKRAFASDEAVQQFIDFAHEGVARSRGRNAE